MRQRDLRINVHPNYQALFSVLAAVQYACTLNKYMHAHTLRPELYSAGTRTLATAFLEIIYNSIIAEV